MYVEEKNNSQQTTIFVVIQSLTWTDFAGDEKKRQETQRQVKPISMWTITTLTVANLDYPVNTSMHFQLCVETIHLAREQQWANLNPIIQNTSIWHRLIIQFKVLIDWHGCWIHDVGRERATILAGRVIDGLANAGARDWLRDGWWCADWWWDVLGCPINDAASIRRSHQ